jgi:hypothetical protein
LLRIWSVLSQPFQHSAKATLPARRYSGQWCQF